MDAPHPKQDVKCAFRAVVSLPGRMLRLCRSLRHKTLLDHRTSQQRASGCFLFSLAQPGLLLYSGAYGLLSFFTFAVPMPDLLTTTRKRLNLDSRPMQLWRKAKSLGTWDPAAIDFSQDAKDWAGCSDREQDLLLRLTAQFEAGEESVTRDLLPLLLYMSRHGRIEDEMFLTAYLWEEAKHVEGFHRFLDEVIGTEDDLDSYLTPAYRTLFTERLPDAMDALHTNGDPATLARACATYQIIVEGTLAETGYGAYRAVLKERNLCPGIRELVTYVQRDEARHVAYGIHLLTSLIEEHDSVVWPVIETALSDGLALVTEHIHETLSPYTAPYPFDITLDLFVSMGMSQFEKRLSALESARP